MGYWCNWGLLNMAHYVDVISCGIKQTHAQFCLLFGLHSSWYFSYFSESASSCDCPTMNSSFLQPIPSSPCGLQIARPPWWLQGKCVLRKEEHPSILECLLTRTTVWVPRRNRVGKLEVPQRFKEQHFGVALCHSMYLVCASNEHPAKIWAKLSVTSPHILHLVLIWSEAPVL